jgi:hypothetical protein
MKWLVTGTVALIIVAGMVGVFASRHDQSVKESTDSLYRDDVALGDAIDATNTEIVTDRTVQTDAEADDIEQEGIFGPELFPENQEVCEYPVDTKMVGDIITESGLLNKEYAYTTMDGQFEKSSWFTAGTSLGRWNACGKSITLVHPPVEAIISSYDAATYLGSHGWSSKPNQEIRIGNYTIGASLNHAGGSGGTDEVYMRTSSGSDAYVEFLVVKDHVSRYGEEDGMKSCPCSQEYTFFISEQYPLKNLLPRAEAEYRKDHNLVP